jgi:hypothetical protein
MQYKKGDPHPNLGALQGEVAEVAGAAGANDPLVDAENTAEVNVCEGGEEERVSDSMSMARARATADSQHSTPTVGGHIKVGREFAVGEAVLQLQAGDAMWWGGKWGVQSGKRLQRATTGKEGFVVPPAMLALTRRRWG